MPTKSQINAALKSAGYTNVKVMDGSFNPRVYRDYDNKMVKGIQGGSIGPMTVTNVYQERNNAAIDRMRKALREAGARLDPNDQSHMTYYYAKNNSKRVTLRIREEMFPQFIPGYYDSDYKSFWIVLDETVENL